MLIVSKPAASSNWHTGRNGHAVLGIVIHVEDGCEMGTIAWFDNPVSKVSAHYSVSKAGQVFQHVDEADEAFHAGTVAAPTWSMLAQSGDINPNLITIGIEHEGLATDDWPDLQYQASAELIAGIAVRHAIPIDADHIIPHHAIRATKSCPGKCDMPRLIAMARAMANGPHGSTSDAA